jgi:hypothetical protein
MADATDVVPESQRPSLGEWFNGAAEILKGKIRGAMPGRVESYDAATQRADVKPLLQALQRNADGSTTSVSLTVVPNVPVMMPQGGGRQIKLPVANGDVVLLVFCDRSLDKWKSKGGEVDPVDLRQHHLSDAIAIAGVRDPTSGASAPTADIEVRADGTVLLGVGAAQGVGLGANIRAELDALWTAITSHLHPVTTAPGTTGPAVYSPAKQTVESATVKAKT